MRHFKIFVVGLFSVLFTVVALPAHSLAVLIPQTASHSHEGFFGLVLGFHPIAAIAWIIVATRNLLFSVLPEPVSMLVLGMGLVGVGSLLRQSKSVTKSPIE